MRILLITSTVLMVVLVIRDASGHPGHANRFGAVREDSVDLQTSQNFAQMADVILSSPIKSRQKRLSDQRRAELETLMALARMSGKFANYTRTGRHLDPAKIGRRKRYVIGKNLPNLQLILRHKGVSINEGSAAYPLIS